MENHTVVHEALWQELLEELVVVEEAEQHVYGHAEKEVKAELLHTQVQLWHKLTHLPTQIGYVQH